MASVYSKLNMASSPHLYFQPQVYGKRSTDFPQMLGRPVVSEMQHAKHFPHGLVKIQAVLRNPQICGLVHPREQILHAPCHQRPH